MGLYHISLLKKMQNIRCQVLHYGRVVVVLVYLLWRRYSEKETFLTELEHIVTPFCQTRHWMLFSNQLILIWLLLIYTIIHVDLVWPSCSICQLLGSGHLDLQVLYSVYRRSNALNNCAILCLDSLYFTCSGGEVEFTTASQAPSHIPGWMTSLTDEMSFFQRIQVCT